MSLFSSIALAQNTNLQDVIYLQNGSVIRGTVIEQVPGELIKIETRDGNVFVYKMEEVSKMTREHSGRNHSIKQNQYIAKSNGYVGFVEIGYGFGVGELKFRGETISKYADRFELDVVNGYQFNPYCFVGLGVGVNIFTNDALSSKDKISIPVFIQGRFNLLNKGVSPFLALNLGYNIDTQRGESYEQYGYTITYPGGIMFEPTLGAAFRVSNKMAATFGISYSLMQFKTRFKDHEDSDTETLRDATKAIRLKFGITF